MRLIALLATGFAAGLVGSVVSLASVISYPALLALGLPPLTANVTNTVSLVFAPVLSTLRSREELRGLYRTALRLAPFSAVGGTLGAFVLLHGTQRSFELVVPALIAFASSAMLLQPALQRRPRFGVQGLTPPTLAALAGVACYTGYFGAAGGVLLMAVLGWILDVSLVRRNAVKNLLASVANGVAAIVFVLVGPGDWTAVPALAAGFAAGGWVGPHVSRRLGDGALRTVICISGLGVAASLAWRTYT